MEHRSGQRWFDPTTHPKSKISPAPAPCAVSCAHLPNNTFFALIILPCPALGRVSPQLLPAASVARNALGRVVRHAYGDGIRFCRVESAHAVRTIGIAHDHE